MDNIFILQELTDSTYRITTNLTSQLFSTNDIIQYLPSFKSIVIVMPNCANSKKLLDDLITKTSISNFIHIIPSFCCCFTFNTENIFYIKLSKQQTITSFVEIISERKFLKEYHKKFEGSEVELVNEISLLLYNLENKNILASNFYIDCDDLELKKGFEEKMIMGLGSNIKHIKFLKVNECIKKSNFCYDDIENDPVSIGGLIGGKIYFLEGGEFLKKDDYFQDNLDKFKMFE